jgi:YhcN/YlaJ family sporulation lipoprotein
LEKQKIITQLFTNKLLQINYDYGGTLMAKRIALIVLAFALAVAVVFTGCTPARRPVDPSDPSNTGLRTDYNNNTGYRGTDQGMYYQNYPNQGDNWGVRDWANNYNTDMYNNNLNNNVANRTNAGTQRADDLANVCEQVQGVEDATVVVTGNTAYVGIDLDTNTNIANERDIKNQVAQKVRASGKDINTVYVSTEVDFMDRLRNVGTGIRNGRPVDAFTTELNEMIQRITPTRW